MSRRRFILWAAAALAPAACTIILLILTVRYRRSDAPDMSPYAVRGIDISRHNGTAIDFDEVARAGYRFVYIKATEGTDFKDPEFIDNIRLAHRAGLDVGVYHFFRFDTDGEMQAINLLHSLRGRHTDLPPAIDIEEWGNPDSETTSLIVRRLRAMLKTLEREGVNVILYTNKDGYERFVRGNFDDYPLWLSSFSTPEADMDWTVWQHSHSGSVPGIAGSTDLNVFNGDSTAYIKFAQQSRTAAKIEPAP